MTKLQISGNCPYTGIFKKKLTLLEFTIIAAVHLPQEVNQKWNYFRDCKNGSDST